MSTIRNYHHLLRHFAKLFSRQCNSTVNVDAGWWCNYDLHIVSADLHQSQCQLPLIVPPNFPDPSPPSSILVVAMLVHALEMYDVQDEDTPYTIVTA